MPISRLHNISHFALWLCYTNERLFLVSFGSLLSLFFCLHIRNIQYYVDKTLGVSNRKQIFVLRTEHLQQDFIDINLWFNQQSNVMADESNVVGIRKPERMLHWTSNKVSRQISTVGRQILCCALRDEIRTYTFLMLASLNLSDESKHESLTTLAKDCGVGKLSELSEAECF